MKIVIVGDGKVGSTLAEQLSRENHDILVIDNDPAAVAATTDKIDVMGVVGNGATFAVQKQAGVDKADLLVAATSMDERNMLCCMVAKTLGAKHTIARVRNPEYAGQMRLLKEPLGLSMSINPERAAADEIARVLSYPSAMKISPFARGRVELVEVKLYENNPLVGLHLAEFHSYFKASALVCAVRRGEDVLIPRGDFVFCERDRVSIVATPVEINALFTRMKIESFRVKQVMICGGSRIAYYLTERLLKLGMRVKIIEVRQERCAELAEKLPGANIICGNAGEQEMLHEEGLDDMDAFVALTGLDEENIIMSMYAGACGVPKVVTKVNTIAFPAMLTSMGLDVVVSPKLITADSITQYVRAMAAGEGSSVETLYKLLDGRVEALEFRLEPDVVLPFMDTPLRNLTLKPQTLVACVIRNGATEIARGDTVIKPGDSVVVITAHARFDAIEDIIA